MTERRGTAEACCLAPVEAEAPRGRCPASGGEGIPVRWITVAALARGPVPERRPVWLCPDADCDLVYFADGGLELRLDDVRVAPGEKIGSSGLACYCFEHSRGAIEDEARRLGTSPTADRIRREVRAKNCACEVRSPTGRCCLREIDELVRRTVKGVA